MPDIFIDKRVFVNGRKSVLNLDNPFNLTGYIIDHIYLFALTCAQNGLNIQATLHPTTGVQQNCVELGGTLLHDTIVDSGTFDLSFTNSNDLTLQANDFFYLQTPAIASASNGWILTLIDKTTGESEWQNSATVPAPSRNGLTTTGGFVELGGDLIHFTEINAQGWNFDIINIESMVFSGNFWNAEFTENVALRSAQRMELRGDTNLLIVTPNAVTSTATIGQVLTLTVDTGAARGQCEWTDLPSPTVNTNIYTNDGGLAGNREVNGQSNSLLFSEGNGFTISEFGAVNVTDSDSFIVDLTPIITLDGTTTSVEGSTLLALKTPDNHLGVPTSAPGDIMTLVNNTTGECEWGAPTATTTKYVQAFIDTDWVIPSVIIPSAGQTWDITIPATTHGRGLNPIVQVQHSGLLAGPLEAVVNTDQTGNSSTSFFGQITIVTAGHLTLQPGDVILTNLASYGKPFGKVIII